MGGSVNLLRRESLPILLVVLVPVVVVAVDAFASKTDTSLPTA